MILPGVERVCRIVESIPREIEHNEVAQSKLIGERNAK